MLQVDADPHNPRPGPWKRNGGPPVPYSFCAPASTIWGRHASFRPSLRELGSSLPSTASVRIRYVLLGLAIWRWTPTSESTYFQACGRGKEGTATSGLVRHVPYCCNGIEARRVHRTVLRKVVFFSRLCDSGQHEQCRICPNGGVRMRQRCRFYTTNGSKTKPIPVHPRCVALRPRKCISRRVWFYPAFVFSMGGFCFVSVRPRFHLS